MRAGRVISMLFALQERGRMTAAELAALLEVSVRTVLRDVETLGAAGVPVYTVQGAGGGIELLDGFRNRLTGITPEEAAALRFADHPALAALFGVESQAAGARRKLLLALPSPLAARAAEPDGWFVHDPLGPGVTPAGRDALRLIARAIRAPAEIRLPGGEVLRPLGLALVAGGWHLVHDGAEGPRVRPLSDLLAADPTGVALGRPFARPDPFDLAAFWRSR